MSLLVPLALAGGAAVPVSAQDTGIGSTPTRPLLIAIRVSTAPVIDGRVNDEVWNAATPYSTFVQQQPDEGQPSTERTEVRVVFDERHVYVGIICFESDPSRIVVTQSQRDGDLSNTDSIQVILDTYLDRQNAFLFGTNPLGLEYDGQIAAEGRTGGAMGGTGVGFGGGSATQRGAITGFNKNWDGDWRVSAQITDRGWEAELEIPLKTLRYVGGTAKTWGINVMRNIRRRNEQAFLAPIPRAYDIYRVSLAGDLQGLDLPPRRDLRFIPYGSTRYDQDVVTLPDGEGDADAGLDVKWGVTPTLTADLTVNTDFAQVEVDEEQVNLTRFDLFYPEKRPFFLENAQTFQLGQPQQVDLFFSRRIGLSRTGEPINIIAGGRLSGRLGDWNVGVLNMQTDDRAGALGELGIPSNNFTVARLQRQVGGSNWGGIFVNRQGMGKYSVGDDWNRAYGFDTNLAVSENGRLFAFIARSDTPGEVGSDYAGRALYDYRNDLWQFRTGYTQVGERFNAEVGFVPRRGYAKPEVRVEFTPEPKGVPWIRRFAPHALYEVYYSFDGQLQSALGHYDFEVQTADGGQFGFRLDRKSDRPEVPFVIYADRHGTRVVIPPGLYTWNEWLGNFESDPSKPIFVNVEASFGSFYDGNFNRFSSDTGFRWGARLLSTLGYLRNDVELPYGDFVANLARLRVSYSFTTRMLLQALVQYNNQTSLVSSNIRFAWLDRSGTGLFFVYNDRRDAYVDGTPSLGRSFIVKYTRLFDF